MIVIIGEAFGTLALLAGFLTRFTAASLAVIMLGTVAMVLVSHGFFMNWFGQQQGEGYESPLDYRDCDCIIGYRSRSMVG